MIDGEDGSLDLAEELEVPLEGEDQQPEDDGELHIEIEGEEEPEETPLIKKLRTELRESQKREADARKASTPAEIIVPPEPDLWDDCEGDPDKYKAALREHDKLKAAAAAQKAAQAEQGQVSQQAFQRAHAVYQAKAETLGVKDFKEAENAVVAALPVVIQSAIVQYAQDPAKLVLGLGRNPAALAKIAAETDPVRQILMVIDMEKRMTVNRKKPPPPEADTIQRGSVSLSATSADKVAENLLKQAQATGDMTPYREHMRAQRAKQG